MDLQQFLYIYILSAVLFGYFFWRAKRNTMLGPAKLKMKQNSNHKKESSAVAATAAASISFEKSTATTNTNKNVIFMYSGHAWDAYEVLNLSPSSSIDEIRLSFNKIIKKEDPSTHDFLKTALEALLKNLRDNPSKK